MLQQRLLIEQSGMLQALRARRIRRFEFHVSTVTVNGSGMQPACAGGSHVQDILRMRVTTTPVPHTGQDNCVLNKPQIPRAPEIERQLEAR